MKRTEKINIGGILFYVDDDAYARLKEYLDKTGRWFATREGGDDVIQDIELRLAEIFASKSNSGRMAITLTMVDEAIAMIGQPEEFDPEEAPTDTESSQTEAPAYKKLYRDRLNSVLGGVCAGLAAYFNIDVQIVRIIFVVAAFISFGAVLLVYLILFLAVPEAVTPAQRLEMCGRPVTFANIGRQMDEGFKRANDEVRDLGRRMTEKHNDRKWSGIIGVAIIVVGIILILNFIGHNSLPAVWHFPMHFGNHFFMPYLGSSLIAIALIIAGLAARERWRYILIGLGVATLIITFLKWLAIIFCTLFGLFC